MPVGVAREQMRAAIDLFIEQALQFSCDTGTGDGCDLTSITSRRLMLRFRTTTGSRKSEQMPAGRCEFVLEQKHYRRRLRYRVAICGADAPPCAEEASSKMLAVFGARRLVRDLSVPRGQGLKNR